MERRGLWIALAVLVLIALVMPILAGGTAAAGTTGPGWCGYWPGR